MISNLPAHITQVATLKLGIRMLLIPAIVFSPFFVTLPMEVEVRERRQEDALLLMSLSQTIIAGEIEKELEYARAPGEMMPGSRPQHAAVDAQLLEAMINSVKYQISVLIKECNEARRVLQERDEECAVSTLDSLCEESKAELRTTLSLLRKVRGDKRKFFTRLGDSIKRAGKRIWHAIGPVGRRILSSLGKDVVQSVISPGGIQLKAFRVLVRSRLKSLAGRELRNTIQRGAEKLILNKWEVARGPKGDECIATEPMSAAPNQAGEDCTGDISWIEEGWPEVEAAMRAEGKYCMDRGEYRLCLRDKTLEGLCPEEVLEVCQPLYDAIPPQGAGEVIEIEDHEAFYMDSDNYLELSIPLDGGAVEGYMEAEFDDSPFSGWYCYVTMTFDFSGTYDPTTCVLNGTGSYTLDYVEDREGDCLGYTGPKEEIRNWGMVIRNGHLDTCGEAPGTIICEGYDLLDNE